MDDSRTPPTAHRPDRGGGPGPAITTRSVTRGHANAQAHAVAIADAVDQTWHGRHGSGDLEIPLSVLAGLSLVTVTDHSPEELAETMLELDADQLAHLLRSVWRTFVRNRTDLAPRAWPLMEPWLGEDRPISDENKRHTLAVGTAAIRAGLLELTTSDRRHEADLLGSALTVMRTKATRTVRGQYYTPSSLADVLAHMSVADEGESIVDPAAGTGGLFRAQAQAMRAQGRNPARVRWVAVDIDHLAIACLAVNAHLWGLGKSVLLGVGDVLGNDWQEQALGERREMAQLARTATLHGLIHCLRDQVTAMHDAAS